VTDEFLDAVYDPGMRAGEWRPALASLREMLGSAEVAFTVVSASSLRPDLWETTGALLTRSECELYERDYWCLDPKMPVLEKQGCGFAFNDVEHFDARFVAHDAFYQGYSLPLGIRHTLDLFADSLPERDVYVAAMRTAKQGPFDDTSEAAVRTAARHLVRALKARVEIARAQSAAENAEAALDGLHFGIAVVDASGRVLFANAFARKAFEASRCIDPARPHAAENPLPRKLREAVQGRPVDFRLRNGEDWLISAVPLRGESALAPSNRAAAMLVYRRAARTNLPTFEELNALYGLTGAEAEIAIGIAEGKPLGAIAKSRSVKLSTVRWQLLSVLRKLGVRRQADVVRVLAAVKPPNR
jgi:DNA-binding CsgD family transcriptional regulator